MYSTNYSHTSQSHNNTRIPWALVWICWRRTKSVVGRQKNSVMVEALQHGLHSPWLPQFLDFPVSSSSLFYLFRFSSFKSLYSLTSDNLQHKICNFLSPYNLFSSSITFPVFNDLYKCASNYLCTRFVLSKHGDKQVFIGFWTAVLFLLSSARTLGVTALISFFCYVPIWWPRQQSHNDAR